MNRVELECRYEDLLEEVDFLRGELASRKEEVERLENLKAFDPRKLSIKLEERSYYSGYDRDSKYLRVELSYDGEVVDSSEVNV